MSESDEEIDFASLVGPAASPPSQSQPNPSLNQYQLYSHAPAATSRSSEQSEDPPRSTPTQRTLFDPSNPSSKPKKQTQKHVEPKIKPAQIQPSKIMTRNPQQPSSTHSTQSPQSHPHSVAKPSKPLNAFYQPQLEPEAPTRKQHPVTTLSSKVPRPSEDQIASSLSKLAAFINAPATEQTKPTLLKYTKQCYTHIEKLEEWFDATESVDESGSITDIDERRSYSKLCATIIITNPSIAAKYNLDTRLWKQGIYPCIEQVRSRLPQLAQPSPFAKASWTALLTIAVQTFTQIIEHTHTKRISSSDTKQTPSMPGYVKYVSYCGDLARYRVILNLDIPTFTVSLDALKGWYRAKSTYALAGFLLPSNGQVWNHLAVFEVSAGNVMTAVVYYVLALSVKVPFPSAHDALLGLCAGHRGRVKEKEPGRQQRAGGKGKKPVVLEETVDSLVVRAFEICFTRINVDSLSSILDSLARSLLIPDDGKDLIPPTFFQHSILLVIFLLSQPEALTNNVSVSKATALQFLSVLWKGMVSRLSLDEGSDPGGSVDALIAFRLIVGWLGSSEAARICFGDSDSIITLEVEFGQLAALARNYSITKGTDAQRLLLEEDWMYRGFSPFKEMLPRKQFDAYIKTSEISMLDLYPRLSQLGNLEDRIMVVKNELWDALEKLPFFRYDETKQVFVFEKPRPDGGQTDGLIRRINSVTDSVTDLEEQILENESAAIAALNLNDDNDSIHSTDHLTTLKHRKTQLSSTLTSQTPPISTDLSTPTHLPSKLLKSSTTLLFDTNCYIRSISTILETINRGWNVLLPLVVITELDGLKFGGKSDAAAALDAIEPLIATREIKPRICCWLRIKGPSCRI
ncbi:hypothetical protein BCR33DRAFT_734480 [Rhizoclosmatium globosum]|uniref:DNA/RNA-binding domain-containing protein n=1 Tax=Rhizoclosmatium globosum TaxID=329046 RepID=A0A1Y2CUN3_9FUNG|nr:hypothetical protein BCR33DRAFT_734480 [Rhizoclosmatium globosum]|eukprot:ORY50544.1 hypothetical protein BCR33DRAFT_734480 [Rhizoclosmatium globosum]